MERAAGPLPDSLRKRQPVLGRSFGVRLADGSFYEVFSAGAVARRGVVSLAARVTHRGRLSGGEESALGLGELEQLPVSFAGGEAAHTKFNFIELLCETSCLHVNWFKVAQRSLLAPPLTS
jgi:hypothetical protein